MSPLQIQILNAALPLIVFDGWSVETLRKAAESVGLPAADAERAFPAGVLECLNLWNEDADRQMMEALSRDYNLASMKIRDRIATAVMVRLRAQNAHREAVRRGAAHYTLPWNAPQGTRALYRTVDAMWRAAGDTATDWNFYSKRALLAKVYLTTFYVWLNDHSDDLADTEAFLRRRIDDVMQIQKWKFKLKEMVGGGVN